MFKKKEKNREEELGMQPPCTLTDNLEPEEITEDQESTEPSEPSEEPEETPQPDPVEQAYCLGAGIDPETLSNAKALLGRIHQAVASSKFDPELLQTAIRILNYDRDMENALKEGYEKARAEQIADAFRNKRAKAEEADSLPSLGGSKAMGVARKESIFDVARDAK